MLRRKTSEAWTEKHRHVTKKLVVEGGWVTKRIHYIGWGWSDEEKCRDCNKEEGTEKHRLYHCRRGRKSDTRSGAKGQNVKERLEVAKRNHVVHPV